MSLALICQHSRADRFFLFLFRLFIILGLCLFSAEGFSGARGGPLPTGPTVDITSFVSAEFEIVREGYLGRKTMYWEVKGSGEHPAGPEDFFGGRFPSDQFTFSEGQKTATITILILKDAIIEHDETYVVLLSDEEGSTGKLQGTIEAKGIIKNDDVNFNITTRTPEIMEGNP